MTRTPPTTWRLATDLVSRDGDEVVIVTRRPMEGWEVRQFRRLAIWLDGRRYAVKGQTAFADGGIRYVLLPWPESLHDLPSGEIVYDEAYVLSRDVRWREQRMERRRSTVVGLLLWPVVGFLPAGVKRRLHLTHGIYPRFPSQLSVGLEWLLVLGWATLRIIHAATGVFHGLFFVSWWFDALMVVTAIDGFARYGAVVDDRLYPPGYLEWLGRRFWPR